MIAVDAALLLPPEANKKVIEINREIVALSGSDIVLDEEKCLPHITLSMGCLREEDLSEAQKVLEDISRSFKSIPIKTFPVEEEELASIRIEKKRDIELLHEIVMIRLSPFLTNKAAIDMFFTFGGEEVNDITLEYVSKFPLTSCFENYTPHITAGYGPAKTRIPSFEFTSSTIALCQLGNFCTCRRILASFSLLTERTS